MPEDTNKDIALTLRIDKHESALLATEADRRRRIEHRNVSRSELVRQAIRAAYGPE